MRFNRKVVRNAVLLCFCALGVFIATQVAMKATQVAMKATQITMKATQVAMKATQITMKATQVTMKATQVAMKATQVATKGGQIATKGGQIAMKEGQITANGGQIATKGGQIATKEGQIAMKGGQIAINGGQIAMKEGQIAMKEGQIATKEGQIAMKEGQIATKGGLIATKGGQIATKGGQIATKGGRIATKGGRIAMKGGQIATKGGRIVTKGGQIAMKGGQIAMKGGQGDEGRTGDCKLGFAACKVATLYPGFGSVPIPMFLDSNFKQFPNIKECGLPFGVNSQFTEKIVEDILSATGNYSLGEDLHGLEEKRCVVVGNGGILNGKSLGQVIDTFDVVVRLNAAPVKGYEADVGSKTTMRILYPTSCPKKTEQVEDQSLFVLSAVVDKDLEWFRHMIFKTKPTTVTFWAPVAQHVARNPADMRILNPYFIKEASFHLIGLPYNKCLPTWGKNANIPTSGAVAITMALHHCDRVYVAGFAYNMSDPDARLHYYENLTMSAWAESPGHNIVKEKQYLAKLVKAGAIEDMTLGIIPNVDWLD